MAKKSPKEKQKKVKIKITRTLGLWLMIIGVVMQLLNFWTYSLWGIDMDIIGALIILAGLAIAIIKWKRK